jgi:hypothetical protein
MPSRLLVYKTGPESKFFVVPFALDLRLLRDKHKSSSLPDPAFKLIHGFWECRVIIKHTNITDVDNERADVNTLIACQVLNPLLEQKPKS